MGFLGGLFGFFSFLKQVSIFIEEANLSPSLDELGEGFFSLLFPILSL